MQVWLLKTPTHTHMHTRIDIRANYYWGSSAQWATGVFGSVSGAEAFTNCMASKSACAGCRLMVLPHMPACMQSRSLFESQLFTDLIQVFAEHAARTRGDFCIFQCSQTHTLENKSTQKKKNNNHVADEMHDAISTHTHTHKKHNFIFSR